MVPTPVPTHDAGGTIPASVVVTTQVFTKISIALAISVATCAHNNPVVNAVVSDVNNNGAPVGAITPVPVPCNTADPTTGAHVEVTTDVVTYVTIAGDNNGATDAHNGTINAAWHAANNAASPVGVSNPPPISVTGYGAAGGGGVTVAVITVSNSAVSMYLLIPPANVVAQDAHNGCANAAWISVINPGNANAISLKNY